MAKKVSRKTQAKKLKKAVGSIRKRELKEYLADRGLKLPHGYQVEKRKRK